MGFKIGIIADSHGEARLIEAAVSFLKSEGCQTIFHLGDICDSYHLAESAACIKLLQDHRIQGVKGNNDHVITRYHATHENLNLTRSQLAFLNHLPLVREYRNAVFAHSLPFEKELGLSCMIRPLDQSQIELFFRNFPGKILFRGHSHDPEIISHGSASSRFTALPARRSVDLRFQNPCIITCGALTEGLCLIWQPEEQTVLSLTF